MAATFKFDELEGSVLELQTLGITRRTRRGRVKGITVNGTNALPDPIVLEKAALAAGFPQIGDGYPAGDGTGLIIPGLYLKRQILRPWTASTIIVDLVYESENPFSNPGTYFIRDSSRLVGETTNMVPGTRVPVKVSWTNPEHPLETVRADYVQFRYEKHYRTVIVSATVYGDPPEANRSMIGTVNDAIWYGYPRGYWRVDAYDTDSRDNGNTWQVTSEVASRTDEDWATYGILINRDTGRYVQVPDGAIDALVFDTPYNYGLDYPVNLQPGSQYFNQPDPTTGVVKIGPYRLSNFTALFGF